MEELMNNELGAFLLYQQVACIAMKNYWYPLAEYILEEAYGELAHFEKFRKFIVDNGKVPTVKPRIMEHEMPETVENIVHLIQKLEEHIEKEMIHYYKASECVHQRLFLEEMIRIQHEDTIEADDLAYLLGQYKEHFYLMLKLKK